jgi:hypothetical protein
VAGLASIVVGFGGLLVAPGLAAAMFWQEASTPPTPNRRPIVALRDKLAARAVAIGFGAAQLAVWALLFWKPS